VRVGTNTTITGGITNSGSIGGVYYGISINNASLTGGITNTVGGTITGVLGQGIGINANSTVDYLTNKGGLISSAGTGVRLSTNSTITGGITNSGSIGGGSFGISINNASLTGGITNTVGGTITGAPGQGIVITGNSTVDFIANNGGFINGITNVGTITGSNIGVLISSGGQISNGINNSGTILGSSAGIKIQNGTVSGGILNTGLIASANGSAISISGTSSNGFGAPISINNTIAGGQAGTIIGAINGNASVTNSGLWALQAYSPYTGAPVIGSTANSSIAGNYYQASSGTLQFGVTGSGGSSTYSTLNVGGAATFENGTNLTVILAGSGIAPGIISGEVTAGALSAGSFNITDNSVLWDFNPIITGNTLDLVATASGVTCFGSVSGTQAGPCLVGFDAPSIQVANTGSIGGGTVGIQVLTGLSDGANTLTGGAGYGINNLGTVIGSQYGVSFAPGATLTGGITNAGYIEGDQHGIRMDRSSLVGGIMNSGVISGGTIGLSIYSSSLQGDINNAAAGIIAGGTSGIQVVASRINGSIVNSGSIYGGLSGGGFITGNGLALFLSSISGDIVNNASGVLSGSFAGMFTYGSMGGSIVNNGFMHGTIAGMIAGGYIGGGITNSGVIQGEIAGVLTSGIFFGSSTVAGSILNNAGGVISGGIVGLGLIDASIGGNISNAGLIQGTSIAAGTSGLDGALTLGRAQVSGGIINSGIIQGHGTGAIGLAVVNSSEVLGGITNSGTISGDFNSIYIDASSTVVGGINIVGTGAKLIGDVSAVATDMNIKSGAVFTNTNAISVNSFNIENGATFNFNNGVSTTYGNTLVGYGGLSITGGIQVVTAVNNAGNLNVGTFTPTITGNYVQTNTGTFSTSIASQTNYGRLNVTGFVALAGTAAVSVLNPATILASGSTLAGVITANTVSGKFAQVTTTGSLLYNFTPVYQDNEFDLVISAVPTPNTDALVQIVMANNNPAALGSATVLDGFINNPTANPNMAPVLDRLSAISGTSGGAGVSNAISQTLPVIVGAGSLIASQTQQGLNQIMQGRQNQLRGLSSGEEYIGNRNAWMKGYGSWANQGNVNNVSGYKVNTGGLAVGADWELSPKASLGAVFAFGNSGVSSNNSAAASGMTVNSYQLGAYGDYAVQADIQVNYQADIGLNNNKEYRNLSDFNGVQGVSSSSSGVNANGNYNSYIGHLGAGLRRFISLTEDTTFIPSVRADYTSVQSQGYTETGAGTLNLGANAQSYNTLLTSADLRVDHMLADKFKLSANVGAGYNALNNQVQMTTAFQGGGPAFTTNGLQISPWLYNAGLGLSGRVSRDVELNVRYDTQFSTSGYNNQMVSAKIKLFY